MRTSFLVLVAGVLSLSSAVLHADLIAYEGFAYPAGDLIPEGSGGTGWTNSWQAGHNTVQDPGLTLAALKSTGGSLQTTNSDWASTRQITSSLGEKTGVYYISFLIRNDTGITDDNYGLVSFDQVISGADKPSFSIGQANFGKKWAIIAPVEARSAVDCGNMNVTILVIKVTWSGDGNDKVQLFVNPAPNAQPAKPDAEITGVKLPPFNQVGLQSKKPFSYDELRIGTTWGDVCPAP